MNKPATRAIGATELTYVSDELMQAEVRRRLGSGIWGGYAGHLKDDLYGMDGVEPSKEVRDDPAVAEAAAYWKRGDRREALHKLENALGRDFYGLGDLKPEDLT